MQVFPTRCIGCPTECVTLRILHCPRVKKIRVLAVYEMVKKFDDMYNRLDIILALDRQTYRQTDGRTDRQTDKNALLIYPRHTDA